jgi:hypothetical protein
MYYIVAQVVWLATIWLPGNWQEMENTPMSSDSYRSKTRTVLSRMLDEAPGANREQLVEAYADILTQLYAAEAHQLLNQVIDDTRTRLDARLSPDPLTQGIASVQATMQDLWRSLWQD